MIVTCLQDILTKRGMSRRELARRSGLNINTVCKLANNANMLIDLYVLDRVCKKHYRYNRETYWCRNQRRARDPWTETK